MGAGKPRRYKYAENPMATGRCGYKCTRREFAYFYPLGGLMAHRLTSAVAGGLLLGAMAGSVLVGPPASADADTETGSATSVSSGPETKASVGSDAPTSKSSDRKQKSKKQRHSSKENTASARPEGKPLSTIGEGPAAEPASDTSPSGPSPEEPDSAPAISASDPTPPAAPEIEATPEPASPGIEIEPSLEVVEPVKVDSDRGPVEAKPAPRLETAAEHTDARPPIRLTEPEIITGTTISSAVAPAATAPAAEATTDAVEPARPVATEKALTLTAAAATTKSTRAPSLVNVVGSVVLKLLTGLIHLIDGPPVLPGGSTVTVHTSSLTLPIGAGRKVQADWYFPEHVDESTRFIYFQHGFLASGPMYSYSAARLAERTNSIVVVPSLSSNFFDPNAEWVNGSTMISAVAQLFEGDRTALTESASAAAGYNVELPQKFVLVGHSAGGTLVTAAAGYMVDNGAIDDLVGIVMLDGVEPKGSHAVADALAKLNGDNDRPIYLISSQRYMWNRHGDMADKLMTARPTAFNGVGLAGGAHIDYMEGGNALIQTGEYIVSGFSKRKNIDAAGLITAGWVNDMFAGKTPGDPTADGVYGVPTQSIPIATRTGTATAVVLPLGLAGRSPIGPIFDPLLTWLLDYAGQYHFVYEPLARRWTISV
jgi:Alpha/beta hydrolase family